MIAFRDADAGDGNDEWDDDDPEFDDDSAEPPTVACPYCRREILEDTPRCPSCERFISAEDQAAPGKPPWIVATALICLVIALWWALATR